MEPFPCIATAIPILCSGEARKIRVIETSKRSNPCSLYLLLFYKRTDSSKEHAENASPPLAFTRKCQPTLRKCQPAPRFSEKRSAPLIKYQPSPPVRYSDNFGTKKINPTERPLPVAINLATSEINGHLGNFFNAANET
jgi:hypothetical protein